MTPAIASVPPFATLPLGVRVRARRASIGPAPHRASDPAQQLTAGDRGRGRGSACCGKDGGPRTDADRPVHRGAAPGAAADNAHRPAGVSGRIMRLDDRDLRRKKR
eukprot:5713450-Pleurochrysis_carterae.AAC.1